MEALPRTHRWRGLVATWSAAAWIVMRQFGVPSSMEADVETRIVRMQPIDRSPESHEVLRDGRVITVPMELVAYPDRDGAFAAVVREHSTSLN